MTRLPGRSVFLDFVPSEKGMMGSHTLVETDNKAVVHDFVGLVFSDRAMPIAVEARRRSTYSGQLGSQGRLLGEKDFGVGS